MSAPGFYEQRWLGPLIDHNDAHRSQLLSTLSTYLRSGDDVNATAAELRIHRSTARYRLNLIRQLTGLDLRDPDNHQALMAATDLWMRRKGSL